MQDWNVNHYLNPLETRTRFRWRLVARDNVGLVSKLGLRALFIIARTWKQPRCPSADEWIRKLWYIYTMEYYSAIKKNRFESVLMRWMKLEPIKHSEVSQKEKHQYSILTHIWEIDGETVETVSDFIFWGSKITADGDGSHEIKRCLLLGRKVMTNLDGILKSRDINILSESHSIVSNSLLLHGLYSPWNSPGQNTGVGSLSLLQGIFPTQGSNPGLLHCRRILYQLNHKGSPPPLEGAW